MAIRPLQEARSLLESAGDADVHSQVTSNSYVLGCKVEDLGFRVEGLGLRV